MKKTITLLLSLAFFGAGAQSFHKGALVTDLHYGFDAYSVRYTTQFIYNGAVIATYKTNDGAVSTGPTLGAQYGLAKWFGLGLRAKYDNYVTSKDSITGIKPAATGFEFGLMTDFHIVKREHFNLSLGLDLGLSKLIYKTNDPAQNYLEIYGDGSWTNFRISPRYYFGRFGLGINLNFPNINYPQMTSSSKALNTYVYSSWKANGFGMTFGVQYRFLNPR